MGEFGWAYLSGAVTGQGPAGSIQFLQDADGQLTGSNYFSFNNSDNNLFLTGSMVISGTIQANTFDVIQTNIIEISQEGSTKFGDDPTDTHVLTGSFQVVSGGMRNHYYTLTSATHTVAVYDHIIGVSSSAYAAIQLPSAADAGAGRVIVIKDEWFATRAEANKIVVSASTDPVDTIDHAATYSITGDSAALTLYSDGISKWFIY
tara:strand:+ start:2235 stop:2849 length:615 start_codon:yes stop_codon:yes gene_type:complete